MDVFIIVSIGILLALVAIVVAVAGYTQYRSWKVAQQSTISGMTALYQEEIERQKKQREKAEKNQKSNGETGKLDQKLHDAGLEISSTTYIMIMVIGVVFGAFFISMIFNSPIVGLIAGVVIALAFYFFLSMKSKSHRALFDEQFSNVLPQIAESIRSGLTVERSIRSVTEHTDDPIREQFRRVNSEVAYGITLAEALTNMADRTGNDDVRMLAVAITIQKNSGGNLSDSIESIAETVQQRLKTRRMVRAETSDARMSLKICAAMPPLVLAIMCATNETSAEFYTQPAGWIVIAIAAIFEIAGIIIMNKMMDIKAR